MGLPLFIWMEAGLMGATAILAYAICRTVAALAANKVGPLWWTALGLHALVGTVAGLWLAFGWRTEVDENTVCYGFPFPLVIFKLEDGQWVDFVATDMYLRGLLSWASIALSCVLPLSGAFLIRQNYLRKHAGAERRV
jgi:hypothetical protein